MTVERCSHRSHSLPHRRHHHLRDRKVEGSLDTQGARPSSDSVRREVVPITHESRYAEEKGALTSLVAPVAEGTDVDIGSAGKATALHTGEEVTESHRSGFYHPLGPARRRPGAPTVQSAVEGPMPRHLSEKSAIWAKAGAAT